MRRSAAPSGWDLRPSRHARRFRGGGVAAPLGANRRRKHHRKMRPDRPTAAAAPPPLPEPVKPVKLRCVGIKPAPACLRRSRARRLPLSLWRRKGGGGLRLLRPSAHPALQLLPAASRADPWSGHCVRAHGRSGRAAAGQGRLTRRTQSPSSATGDKMPRIKRKSSRVGKIHDRRSRDLPLNAEVVAVEVDDPMALEPGDKIVALRSIRGDPLGWLHSHHQIDDAQYRGGRAFQNDWERAERGPQAVDPEPGICRRRAAARADHRRPAQRRAAPQSRRARARRRRIGAGP